MLRTVLVTGGAGFLGSNLCRALLKENFEVIALDDLSTGTYSNIKGLESHPNFRFIKHDVIFPLDLKVGLIFNLACPASPPKYQEDPIKTTKVSVLGSLNMLELAKNNGAKILQASTSEVYGDPEVHPQTESYRGNVNPIGPRACYDEGKRCAESLYFDYHRKYGVEIKVVRIFNTYGPYMDPYDGRVVSNFIVNAIKGDPLEVYGDGNQTRSFCFVDDMISGLIRMMSSDPNVTGPINLGNPDEFTVKELADIVLSLTKSNSEVVYKPLPVDDPVRRRPDISISKKNLSWSPAVQLKEGLEKTIFYFNKLAVEGSL